MVKHIQSWDITKKLENKHKVYIRHFAESKVICMNDYVKPCIHENNPDHIIFHVATNDIPTSKDPPAIPQSIVDLTKSVMTQDRGVTVSGIIPRNDQWKNKVREVNDSLTYMCENDNISFLDHSGSIDPRKNLNNSKLHLNVKGSNKLRDKFVRYLKGFSSWDSDTQSYSETRHDKSIIGETPPVDRNENLRFSSSFDNISLSECLSNLRQRILTP